MLSSPGITVASRPTRTGAGLDLPSRKHVPGIGIRKLSKSECFWTACNAYASLLFAWTA
jgi:hypothetical protein